MQFTWLEMGRSPRVVPCVDDVCHVVEQRVVQFADGVNVPVEGVLQVE